MPSIHTPPRESWNMCLNLLIGGRGLIITVDMEVVRGLLRYCSQIVNDCKSRLFNCSFLMYCSKHKISTLLVLKNLVSLEFIEFSSSKSEVLVLLCYL